jgi:hypothetical protein
LSFQIIPQPCLADNLGRDLEAEDNSSTILRFLAFRNGEMINVCCFKPPGLFLFIVYQ